MNSYYMDLETEKRNHRTEHIDQCTTEEIVKLINEEDAMVPKAVEEALPQIVQAVDSIYLSLRDGGHLIYIGAGTSGRLGVLDASECVPTFGVEPDLVQGCIAGGDKALRTPIEGCEDNEELGRDQIAQYKVKAGDVVAGISASGSAAFVMGALKEAKKEGAVTIAVVNNLNSRMKEIADICIEAVTGPEVVSGSTRMKAGTAQKMILNMLSTASMIKLGKVYGNMMVDLKASNKKLEERAARIFCTVTGKEEQEAQRYLHASGWDTKLAVMMCLSGLDRKSAADLLKECGGFLGRALESAGVGQGKRL